VFYRRRTDEETITRVVTLVGHGCPIPAIEVAYGFQAQTVREWVEARETHAEAVHHATVVQPRDLVQVQADEIHVKTQAGVLWMAMAMMVSTRLWLGGAVSAHRDRDVIGRLVAIVAACAQWGPLLFVTDGVSTYSDVMRKAFRTRQTGTGGRPRLVGWPDLAIAQVVTQYAGRAVTGTIHRLVHGTVQTFLTLLWSTPGCQVLNTAYIERLNGTFRSCLASLGRRTRLSIDLPAHLWRHYSLACRYLTHDTTLTSVFRARDYGYAAVSPPHGLLNGTLRTSDGVRHW